MGNHTRPLSKVTAIGLVMVLGLLMPLSVAAQDAQPTARDVVTRQQVKELQSEASDVEVMPVNGPKVRGRIQWFDDVSFGLREKNGQERTWYYSEVAKVRKKGLSWAAKLAFIGGAAIFVMCVAPFPFGFLCHEDPS